MQFEEWKRHYTPTTSLLFADLKLRVSLDEKCFQLKAGL
jgi:hypothetical protein